MVIWKLTAHCTSTDDEGKAVWSFKAFSVQEDMYTSCGSHDNVHVNCIR